MKILLCEDNDEKAKQLSAYIEESLAGNDVNVARAATLSAAQKCLYERAFDLVILDLMLPLRDGQRPEDVSEHLIGALETSDKNKGTNVIALTGFDDLVEAQRQKFLDSGIILVGFEVGSETWRRQLDVAVARIRQQTIFDFVVVCALDKERTAYRKSDASIGEYRNIRGLDCLEMTIGTSRGLCIKLPRMGLVNAAIVTARAIELFSPSLVAMSGICAGVKGRSKIGQLVVPDMCWEYQAGKWANNSFKLEHFDAPIKPESKTVLSQLVEPDLALRSLKAGLLDDPIVDEEVTMDPMATGSAVISDSARIEAIGEQHRKMVALDMEMYGVFQASRLSAAAPIFVGAKTVVDLADEAKDDRYHDYGCVLSARFITWVIPHLLASVGE